MIVDAESVFLTDTDGADILIQSPASCVPAAGLVLARVHPSVLGLSPRAGVVDALGEHGVHETIDGAVVTLTAVPPPTQVT